MKEIIIEQLYKIIKVPYQFMFKNNKPWEITNNDFSIYPEESLGYHYGKFLSKHNFNIQESLEEHDVYHVLTNTGITVKDEIDMQCYLLGNGKKTPFVFIVIATGILFYPYSLPHFFKSYKKGKEAHQFYYLDFYKMLPIPLKSIQYSFNIK